MSKKGDSNYVSVMGWMWMQLVTAIPIVGQIMILVWAFSGENDSRKNYYRAILAWLLVVAALILMLVVFDRWPAIHKQIQGWAQKI